MGCGPQGATDAEVEAALGMRHQTASARRRDLVKADLVTDSGQRRATDSGRQATVWVASKPPEAPTAPPVVASGLDAMRIVAEPEHPLQPTQRGLATAAVALVLRTLLGTPPRLLWVVDLDTVRPGPAIDPSRPDSSEWGALLERFRTALDLQAWGTGACAPLGLHVTFTCQITARRVTATFAVPHGGDLRVLTGAPPPVGSWLLWPVPEEQARSTDLWWLNDIPF